MGLMFGAGYQGTGDIGTTLPITKRSLLIEFDSDHIVKAYRFSDAESHWHTKCAQYCR